MNTNRMAQGKYLIVGLVTLPIMWLIVSYTFWPPRFLPREVSRALDRADSIELYQLGLSDKKAPNGETFHGLKIITRAQVSGPDKDRLLRSLHRGILTSIGPALCWGPGYGLRVAAQGTDYDLRADFHCGHIDLYRNDTQKWGSSVSPSPESVFKDILAKKR